MATAIKERPILFSCEMVRAILGGRKSMARRVVKIKADGIEPAERYPGEWQPWRGGERLPTIFCPYGEVGERLWVRETWSLCSLSQDGRDTVAYRADGAIHDTANDIIYEKAPFTIDDLERDQPTVKWAKWTPSIHMPRWASRLMLEVTGVRVERLHEITDQDCEREGVVDHYACEEPNLESHDPDDCGVHRCNPIADFRRTWDALNGPRGFGWDSNPWVWVVSFKRLEPNKC